MNKMLAELSVEKEDLQDASSRKFIHGKWTAYIVQEESAIIPSDGSFYTSADMPNRTFRPPVALLCTRVKLPDADDQNKLTRVMQ